MEENFANSEWAVKEIKRTLKKQSWENWQKPKNVLVDSKGGEKTHFTLN